MPTTSFGPSSTIESAFKQLKESVSRADAIIFQSTTLEDVWKAAEEIERLQRQRRSLRCMKKIQPFLDALEIFSKPIEILCNGTPFLPWAWAPIKLMLQLAAGHADIFDKLIDAYARIGEAMPQIDKLQSVFDDDQNFRGILAMVYSDILEFHRRAYKFFRRKLWFKFFDACWTSFDTRFHNIIDRLERHKRLLTKAAITIDLVEARKWRLDAQLDLEAREKARAETQIHDMIAWLNSPSEQQENELEELLQKRHQGTCDWIFQNPKMMSWRDDIDGEPVLWVKGIPGAGKTILCSYIIDHIQKDSGISAAYYICNSYSNGKRILSEIMKSLAVQLLRKNLDLAPWAFENFANKGNPPSISHLRNLLSDLLLTIPKTRICIDGLDESPQNEQSSILQELLSLIKSAKGQCRILFSSREVTQIIKALGKKPTISFRDEQAALEKDIQAYVVAEMAEIKTEFKRNKKDIDEIQDQIIDEADGMFMWVKLVIIDLKQCKNLSELKQSAETMPKTLEEAYERIIDRVMKVLPEKQKAKALRILYWLACSERTLSIYEIRDGISFHSENTELNEETKLPLSVIDLCKPLIEERGGIVDFIHLSAKEYILNQERGFSIRYEQAQYDIAFSCITYLNTTLCFHDENFSEASLRFQVISGFHGLYPYANEFWFQHLLQYAKCAVELDSDHKLDASLEQLLNFWKKPPGLSANSMKLDDTTTVCYVEDQLAPLKLTSMSWVVDMARDLLIFRAYLSQEKFSHQSPNYIEELGTKHDPTHFSRTGQRYQKAVQFLLQCTADDFNIDELTPEMLLDFHSTYKRTGFICRYLECPRHSAGFDSSSKRDEHESTHAKPLRCADPSCEFFARGFSSKSGLVKHNRKYHVQRELEPPKFEPRRLNGPPAEPEIEPPASTPKELNLPPPLPPPAIPKPVPEARQAQSPVKRVSRARRGMRVHKCTLCPKIFTRNEGLTRHQLSHRNPTFICDYEDCHRAFYRDDLLARHQKRHELSGDPKPPFPCEYENCRSIFQRSTILADHHAQHELYGDKRASTYEPDASVMGQFGNSPLQ